MKTVKALMVLVLLATGCTTAAPAKAKLGDLVECPVLGQTFRLSDDTPRATFEGHTYYFCCEECLRDFERSPQKFAGKPKQTSR